MVSELKNETGDGMAHVNVKTAGKLALTVVLVWFLLAHIGIDLWGESPAHQWRVFCMGIIE